MWKKSNNIKALMEMDTAAFMEELFEDLKEKATEKGLTAEFILDKSLPGKLRADGDFLRESFSALFSQCTKRTQKGIISFAVGGHGLEEDGCALRVSVSEGGNGFTREQLELFEDKKDSSQDEEVSRLHTIRKEAEKRKGAFTIYSVFGGGALYYLILPGEILDPATIDELEKKKNGLHNVKLSGMMTEEDEPESKWIDRDLALNYAGGTEEMRLEMLGIYYDQAQLYLKELPELFEAENWEKYRIIVHAIKGNSLGIGAEGFSREAYEQEMAAKNGDIQKIKAEFENFYDHYQSLVEEVRKSKI